MEHRYRRTGRLRTGVAVFAVLCALLCLPILVVGVSGAAPARMVVQETDTLPDFVLSKDVILEGKVIAIARSGYRNKLGGCSQTGLSPFPIIDATVLVLKQHAGICNTETLVVAFADFQPSTAPPLQAGSEVLLWGYYNCHDAGTLWASFAIYDQRQGSYVHYPSTASSVGVTRVSAYNFSRLGTQLTVTNPSLNQRQVAAASFDAVALYRVSGITPTTSDAVLVKCAQPRILFGKPLSLPIVLEVPSNRNCSQLVQVGDTLVVPLFERDGHAVAARVTDCFGSLVLRSGHIRYFGAKLSDLERLVSGANGGSSFGFTEKGVK